MRFLRELKQEFMIGLVTEIYLGIHAVAQTQATRRRKKRSF